VKESMRSDSEVPDRKSIVVLHESVGRTNPFSQTSINKFEPSSHYNDKDADKQRLWNLRTGRGADLFYIFPSFYTSLHDNL